MDGKVAHDLPISKEDEVIVKKAKLDSDGKAAGSSSNNWEPDEVEKRYPRKERVMMLINKLSKEAKGLFGKSHDEECDDGSYSKRLFQFASYELDMLEHHGFDFDFGALPNRMTRQPGNIAPLYHPPHMMRPPIVFDKLMDCARLAIKAYNLQHGAHFDNVYVLKANAQAMAPIRYYITFTATDEKKNLTLTFETMVNYVFPLCDTDPDREVELVRIKPPFRPFPEMDIEPSRTRDDDATAVN